MKKDHSKYYLHERYINRFKFKGIPMGGTLADQFIMINNHGCPGILKTSSQFVYEFLSMFKSLFLPSGVLLKTHLLSTRLADKTHFNNMIEPLIQHFKSRLTLIYNPEIKIRNKDVKLISIKDTFNTPSRDIPRIMNFWMVFFFKMLKNRRRLRLSVSESFYYSLRIMHQSRIISFYHYQFSNCKELPTAIVTEFDRNSIASPLILTGKRFGVKTVTLVHGTLNNFGYTPVLADYIYCFGNNQKEQLIALEVPVSKIKVTGTSIISEIRHEASLSSSPEAKLRICLGINPFSKGQVDFMIGEHLEAIKNLRNCELIIKLHPSQKKSTFVHYADDNQNVIVLSSSEIDNYKLFAQIDLLVINNSGLGIEASLNNVVVAVFNIPEKELGIGAKLVEHGGAPLLNNSTEIYDLIKKIKDSPIYLQSLRLKAKNFAREYYYATGVTASRNIINELEILLTDKN